MYSTNSQKHKFSKNDTLMFLVQRTDTNISKTSPKYDTVTECMYSTRQTAHRKVPVS